MNASIAGGRRAYLLASLLLMIVVCVAASALLRPVTASPRSAASGSAIAVQADDDPGGGVNGLPWGLQASEFFGELAGQGGVGGAGQLAGGLPCVLGDAGPAGLMVDAAEEFQRPGVPDFGGAELAEQPDSLLDPG